MTARDLNERYISECVLCFVFSFIFFKSPWCFLFLLIVFWFLPGQSTTFLSFEKNLLCCIDWTIFVHFIILLFLDYWAFVWLSGCLFYLEEASIPLPNGLLIISCVLFKEMDVFFRQFLLHAAGSHAPAPAPATSAPATPAPATSAPASILGSALTPAPSSVPRRVFHYSANQRCSRIGTWGASRLGRIGLRHQAGPYQILAW